MSRIIYLLLLVVVSQCASVKPLSVGGVEVLGIEPYYSEEVSFELVNNNSERVRIESLEHLYIEENRDGWNRVPFVPCLCGTPCKPAGPVTLLSGEKYELNWNLISRKCTSNGNEPPETIENKVPPGEYRMTFMINRSENGMRLKPEKLQVNFEVR